MAFVRILVGLACALALAVTSLQMASARGHMAAVDHAVLCIDGQQVTVALDINGEPTEAGHTCLDCLLSVFAEPPVQGHGDPAELARTTAYSFNRSDLVFARSMETRHPRGPPELG